MFGGFKLSAWWDLAGLSPSGSSGKWAALNDSGRLAVLLCGFMLTCSWAEWAGGARPGKAAWKGAGGRTEHSSWARREESVCKQTPCMTFGTVSS